MRRPGKIARAVKFYTSPLYYITSRLSSQGVWRNFFCFNDLKWYSAKLRASRSGVKFCARPDRRAVSNFIGGNQLEPAAKTSCSCKLQSRALMRQIIPAAKLDEGMPGPVKFQRAANRGSCQILSSYSSCKPAVKFQFKSSCKSAGNLFFIYNIKPHFIIP